MREIVATAVDDMLKVAKVQFYAHPDRVEFIFQSGPLDDRPVTERLDAYDSRDAFHWMCDGFCDFLDQGVRTGDGRWPPAP